MLRNPEKVSSILPNVLERLGLKKGIEQHKALIIWDQVVGKCIASHTKPGWVIGGILWVIVDDSVWQQELEFLKHQIVDKINKYIEGAKIRGIKFIQRR
ncbi:MAG: DUF721 domain-containing protein [bacterium]|nr:DUF721 domain-containing protein [bacterium]